MADAGSVPPRGVIKRFLSNPTTWSAVLVIAFAGVIYQILNSGSRPIVDQFPQLEFARGVISIVFVFFTIGFAAIVLIHGLFVSDTVNEDRRFTRGREVLGLFIGIVGTIVGFYFGSTDKQTSKMEVAVQAKAQSQPGDVLVNLHAFGGTAPYRFTITAGKQKLTETPIASDDGWLTKVLNKVDGKEITVEASDTKDLRATKKETIAPFSDSGK